MPDICIFVLVSSNQLHFVIFLWLLWQSWHRTIEKNAKTLQPACRIDSAHRFYENFLTNSKNWDYAECLQIFYNPHFADSKILSDLRLNIGDFHFQSTGLLSVVNAFKDLHAHQNGITEAGHHQTSDHALGTSIFRVLQKNKELQPVVDALENPYTQQGEIIEVELH